MKLTKEQSLLINKSGVVQLKPMTILDRVKQKKQLHAINARIEKDLYTKVKREAKKRKIKITSILSAAFSTFLEECLDNKTKAN